MPRHSGAFPNQPPAVYICCWLAFGIAIAAVGVAARRTGANTFSTTLVAVPFSAFGVFVGYALWQSPSLCPGIFN